MDSNPTSAAEFLALARSNPAAALERLDQILALAESGLSLSDRSIVLRAGGLASRLVDLSRSRALLTQAVSVARQAHDPAQIAESQLTLAGTLFLAGESHGAVQLLEELEANDDLLRGRAAYQLGTIRARMGHSLEALHHFDRADGFVAKAGDERMVAMVHQNRAMLRLLMGDYLRASADIELAISTFGALGIEVQVAGAMYGRAMIEMRSGDLPKALEQFTAIESEAIRLAGSGWEIQAGRCEALLSAGLAQEAAVVADRAATELERGGFHLDRAEALLAKSEAELALGHTKEGANAAEEAAQAFRAQGRAPFAASAQVISLSQRQGSSVATRIRVLAAELDATGMRAAGLNGWIRAADAERSTQPDDAIATLATISNRVRRADLQTRISYAAALGDALLQAGRRRSAGQVASAAARALEEHQSLIGLSDIRLSFRPYANRIFATGLEMALKSSRNDRIFDWIERTAVSRSLVRRAAPVQDPDLRSALTALSTLKDNQDRASRRRRVELESTIRLLARTRAPRIAPQRVAVESIAIALDQRMMVSFAAVDGRAFALRLRDGRLRRFVVGATTDLLALVRQVRASLTRTAASPTREHVAESARLLGRLDDTLLGPLRLGSAPVTLIAPAGLAGVPWSGLPSRRGIPTVVARSAAAWFDCDKRTISSPGGLLVITGPDLEHADNEAAAIAATAGTVEIADRESVGRLVEQVERADVVHAVCHGDLRSDNPLFSSMRLHAGNVHAYQMQQLIDPPAAVVLSACHLGLAKDSPGALLLGFTDALLSAGTSTVIASTLPVPDTATTAALMADLHHRMAAGDRPATALANSQAALHPDIAPLYASAFTCFGAG